MISDALGKSGISIEDQLRALRDVKNVDELPEDLKTSFRSAIDEVNVAYENDVTKAEPLVLPPHTTGGAVDIFFVEKTGKGVFVPVWEGKPGALSGNNPTSPTFCKEGLRDREKLLRKLFYLVMLRAGFNNYLNEYWHFERGTKLAASYNQGNLPAIFGMVFLEKVLRV